MAHLSQYLLVLLGMFSVALMTQFVSGSRNTSTTTNLFPSCNERVCWPKIAMCNLFNKCGCEFKSLESCGPCCKKCKKCLRQKWNYCCGCLKMCPQLNRTASENVMSTTGDLKGSIPSLFEALSYGSKLPFNFVEHKVVDKEVSHNITSIQTSCKVGFFYDCTSLDGCEDTCHQLGSSRYRWFHNGCCQCIGSRCRDYGKRQSLCKNCKV